jgi:hypothetical protein
LLVAEIDEHLVDLAVDLLEINARDADTAGLGDLLETRRDVDPIAVDVTVFDDDIAEVHPDPELKVFSRNCLLPSNGTVDSIDRADELRDAPRSGVRFVPYAFETGP